MKKSQEETEMRNLDSNKEANDEDEENPKTS